MILIGDNLVPYEKIFMIYHKNQIKETEANSTIIFNYNSDIMKYASTNSVSFAPIATTVKEAIYANALGAKYIIVKRNYAKEIQTVAENYMFDSKILAIIEHSGEIESIAKEEIDGVIYKNILE